MESMICGSRSIRRGRALIRPFARPSMILNAAASTLSMLSRSVFTIVRTAAMTAGMSFGRASPIPDARAITIVSAALTNCGRFAIMPPTSASTS